MTTTQGIVSMARTQQQSTTTPQTTAVTTPATTTTATTTAAPQNVNNWYRNALGRDAEQGGLTYWNGRLQNGEDPNAVYNELLNSARTNNETVRNVDYQAANTYDGPSSRNGSTPVDEWGRNVLGRELTAEEVQRYSYDGTPEGAEAAYSRFLQDNAGQVRATMDRAAASQINGQPLPMTARAPAQAAEYQAAQLGNPTSWQVTPDQTVEGRVNQILNPDSPIIQAARARAAQAANERGLLNSAMAMTAGEAAAYDAAIPIATNDAATAAKAAGYNADMRNQFDVRNVDATNTARQFNASAQNVLTGQKLSADTQLATAQISSNTQRVIADLEAQTRTSLAHLDAQTKTNLAQLDGNIRTELATIEANYKNLMQSNASASDLYRQITQNITNISMSTDMDADAKTRAVASQMLHLQNGMGIIGQIGNLNLSDLLDFSGQPGFDESGNWVGFPDSEPAAPTPAAPATPTGWPLGSDNSGGA